MYPRSNDARSAFVVRSECGVIIAGFTCPMPMPSTASSSRQPIAVTRHPTISVKRHGQSLPSAPSVRLPGFSIIGPDATRRYTKLPHDTHQVGRFLSRQAQEHEHQKKQEKRAQPHGTSTNTTLTTDTSTHRCFHIGLCCP